MKKLVLLFLITMAPLALAATTFPAPSGFVNDFANVIDPVYEAQINAIVTAVESNTTAEIAVVTVNSTAPLSPFEYRVELFDEWNIGKADKDNGLLILYAVAENRIEVEVGYGLEGILNDAKIGRILDEYAVPYKTAGNYSEMLLQTTEAIGDVIMQNADEVRSGQASSSSDGFDNWFLLVWLLFAFGFPMLGIMAGEKCPKCKSKMKLSHDVPGTSDAVYVCPKCGTRVRKKKKSASSAFFYAGGLGGHSGGGFGGFGGGGSGGGGAGR